jgi:hypothetical protein
LLERESPTIPTWDPAASHERMEPSSVEIPQRGQDKIRISMLEPPREAIIYPHGGK